MGLFSKLAGKATKTGVRFGDRAKLQKGSSQTSTSKKNVDSARNRNDYVPNLNLKQAGEDLTKIKKAVGPSKAKGAARAAEKEAGVRAASRTAMRAAPAAAAGATVAAMKSKEEKKKTETPKPQTKTVMAKDERANKADYPVYKKGTESSKAFKEAFSAAVDKKQKTFTFEGRKYSTEKK